MANNGTDTGAGSSVLEQSRMATKAIKVLKHITTSICASESQHTQPSED